MGSNAEFFNVKADRIYTTSGLITQHQTSGTEIIVQDILFRGFSGEVLDLKLLSPNIGWNIGYPTAFWAFCGFPQSQQEKTASFQVFYN
jgi:hypothetical protein